MSSRALASPPIPGEGAMPRPATVKNSTCFGVRGPGRRLAVAVGILITVWGILIAFSELGSGGSAGSNMAILGGLSTALATTVMGLIIAIPALVSSNYLRNRLKYYSSDMEEFLYELLSSVELQYRKADVS